MGSIINDVIISKDFKRDIINDFVNFSKLSDIQKKKLKKIQKKYQKKVFSLLLYKLTSVYFEPDEAKKIWDDIIKHKKVLSSTLKRAIDIEVAILDFFLLYKHDIFDNPLIVEEKIFESIKQRILVDELTGLFNYRYFKQRIKEEISKSKRYHQPFSVLMLDIDGFKSYNDTFGHIEGNKVLIKIARELGIILRSSDIIIRFGGEEFLIILPHTSKKEALMVGEKIRKTISRTKFRRMITISGGVATFLVDTKATDTSLIKLADAALYRAKFEGKNRICNYPKERRIFKRIPLGEKIDIQVRLLNKNVNFEKIKNISKGGISAFINKKLEKGSNVEGKLKKKSRELRFIGRIMWCNEEDKDLYETGIKFLDIPDKRLKEFELE